MRLRLKGVQKREQLTLQKGNLQLEFKEGIGVFQVAKARTHILGKHKLPPSFPSKQCIEPRLACSRGEGTPGPIWSEAPTLGHFVALAFSLWPSLLSSVT